MADIKTMWLPGAPEPQELADTKARAQLENKLDTTALPEAVNTALAQAKASGEFDGAPGDPGYTPVKDKDYFDGKDGVSPTVAVSDIAGGHRIAITDKNGTKTVDVMDGEKGDTGDKGDTGATGPQGPQGPKGDTGATGPAGKDGSAGAAGTDGVSPTVSVSKSGKVTTITITDKNGTKTVDVMDGAKGDPGSDAAVTSTSIKSALGYTPLNPDDWAHETEYTVAPYTNMLDRYGCMARTGLNRDGSTYEADWNVWTTNYIPVRKGQKLRIKYNDGTTHRVNSVLWALYDENKTFHSDYNISIYLTAIEQYPNIYGTVTVNGSYAEWDTSTIGYDGWNGFAYARLMIQSTDCVITIDEEITDDVETVYELKPTLKVPKDNLSFNAAEKPLVGKKVVCFGDSLFGQTRDDTSALHYTAQITGADLYNVGFGGTSAAKVGSGAFAQFSFPALADAITSGTWTTQDSNVSAATGWNEQLPKLKTIDFSAVDIIVLHYGTNDFMSAYTLEGTAVSTVCGGLRYGIEKILAKYPQIKVYVSLPCFRYWGSEGAYVYPDAYTNSNGEKLTDFVEGIRKVAAEYNFLVVDGFYGLGVNKLNASHFLADQTHHSVAGRKLFGEFIAAQITGQQSIAKSGMDTDAVQGMIDSAIGAAIGGAY